MKEGLNADITQQLVSVDGLQLDKLMNHQARFRSLFLMLWLYLCLKKRFYFLVKEDTLNKCCLPAFFGAKI